MANPFPFVSGSALLASQLNGIGEAWTSYTPQLSQSVNVTSTISYAKFARVNKIVHVLVAITSTGAGTAGFTIRVTLPVPHAGTGGPFGLGIGAGGFFDASSATQIGVTALIQGATIGFYGDFASGGGSLFGQFPVFTLANGDVIFFSATYEVA